MKKLMVLLGVVAVIGVVAGFFALGPKVRSALKAHKQVQAVMNENSLLKREAVHYRSQYSTFAATERHRQYGVSGENVALFYGNAKEFTPIDDVTEKLICPKPVKDPPNGYTFFGIRSMVIPRKSGSPLFYTMSYTGNHAFIRDKDWFDLLLDLDRIPNLFGFGQKIMLSAKSAAGLMNQSPRKHTRNGSFITPFSYNTYDVNADGTDDFFFGGRLFLSNGVGSFDPIKDASLDEREVTFIAGRIYSQNGGTLEEWEFANGNLKRKASITLVNAVAKDKPFTVMPTGGAISKEVDALVLTANSYDFYRVRGDRAELMATIPMTTPHLSIIGARGDFDGDGVDDLWLSENRWKNSNGQIVGRVVLLSSRKFAETATVYAKLTLEQITGYTLYGVEQYTDYDGIGASLSPIAGDFDGDGKPDLSVPGHIHLNEAGALYVMLGKDMVGAAKDIADRSVIRIAGKPVSNLAPPFVHYDAGNRIVMTADNDLCSGIAGGAVYVLDISKRATIAAQ